MYEYMFVKHFIMLSSEVGVAVDGTGPATAAMIAGEGPAAVGRSRRRKLLRAKFNSHRGCAPPDQYAAQARIGGLPMGKHVNSKVDTR